MKQYFRIFLYILSGIFLFVFTYITFFSEQLQGLQNSVNIDQTGFFELSYASGAVQKQKVEGIKDFDFKEGEIILLDSPSKFDAFYAQIGKATDYERKSSELEETISIGLGEYYFSLNDTGKTYELFSEYFNVEVISEGSLYIKNSGRRIGFYSFDGIFKINYKDTYTGKYVSSFYVFPGMYAKGTQFQKQDEVDENSDAENELFYINNLQLTGKKARETSASKVLMYSFNFIYNTDTAYGSEGVTNNLRKILGLESSATFLDIVYFQEQKERNIFRNAYSHLEGLQEYERPIFDDVQGYFSIFLNRSKKIVYYKNLLLGDFSELVRNIDEKSKTKKVIDNDYGELKTSIQSNMGELEKLSKVDYEAFLNFFEDYYYFYTEIYPSDFSTKYHITDLYNKFHGITEEKNTNDIYLTHLYSLYNDREISRLLLNEGLIKYMASFSRSIDTTSAKSFYYYYYAYNKILKNHIETLGVKKEGLEDIISILENIAFIGKGYFTTEEVKKGMLYINIEIIESISAYLYKLYFEVDRNPDNLLVLKNNDFDIDDILIINLQENLYNLFRYQNESAVLNKNNENELSLLQRYERLAKESDEYFEAIIYNDEYRNAKAFDTLEQISAYNRDTFEKPSVSGAKEYLDYFVQVQTKDANITVVDGSYYEIEDIIIGDELVSFELYPLEFNKLTNIKKQAPALKKLSDILGEEEANFRLKDEENLDALELYEYFISLGNIEISPDDIQIRNGEYFTVKNINIAGVKYSFKLYPKSDNALKDVMEGLGVTYKIDNIKPDENARNKVKAEEEFKNFFVNLLIKNKNDEIIIINEDERNANNDSIEVNIFKNDFLFGKRGDFSNISNLINLEFNNVSVEEYKNAQGATRFKTIIDEIDMVATSEIPKTDRGELVQAKVDAEYYIEAEKSVFKKIALQFYFIRSAEEDIRLDFAGEKMQVLGELHIDDFRSFYENVWSDYKSISQVHQRKEKILGEAEVTNFRYVAASRDAIISYRYKGRELRISFQEGKVFKVNYDNEVLQGEEVKNIDEVFKYFL